MDPTPDQIEGADPYVYPVLLEALEKLHASVTGHIGTMDATPTSGVGLLTSPLTSPGGALDPIQQQAKRRRGVFYAR